MIMMPLASLNACYYKEVIIYFFVKWWLLDKNVQAPQTLNSDNNTNIKVEFCHIFVYEMLQNFFSKTQNTTTKE